MLTQIVHRNRVRKILSKYFQKWMVKLGTSWHIHFGVGMPPINTVKLRFVGFDQIKVPGARASTASRINKRWPELSYFATYN